MRMAAKQDLETRVLGQAYGDQAECYYLNEPTRTIRCNVFNGRVRGRDGKGRETGRDFPNSWGPAR